MLDLINGSPPPREALRFLKSYFLWLLGLPGLINKEMVRMPLIRLAANYSGRPALQRDI